jgi:hypothetical protein
VLLNERADNTRYVVGNCPRMPGDGLQPPLEHRMDGVDDCSSSSDAGWNCFQSDNPRVMEEFSCQVDEYQTISG